MRRKLTWLEPGMRVRLTDTFECYNGLVLARNGAHGTVCTAEDDGNGVLVVVSVDPADLEEDAWEGDVATITAAEWYVEHGLDDREVRDSCGWPEDVLEPVRVYLTSYEDDDGELSVGVYDDEPAAIRAAKALLGDVVELSEHRGVVTYTGPDGSHATVTPVIVRGTPDSDPITEPS